MGLAHCRRICHAHWRSGTQDTASHNDLSSSILAQAIALARHFASACVEVSVSFGLFCLFVDVVSEDGSSQMFLLDACAQFFRGRHRRSGQLLTVQVLWAVGVQGSQSQGVQAPRQWERSRSLKQRSQPSGRTVSTPRVSTKLCGLPEPGASCPRLRSGVESCKKFLDRARQTVVRAHDVIDKVTAQKKSARGGGGRGRAETRSIPGRSVKACGSASTGVASDRCIDSRTRCRSHRVGDREETQNGWAQDLLPSTPYHPFPPILRS